MPQIILICLLIFPTFLCGTVIDRVVGHGRASRVLNEAREKEMLHELTEWSDIEAWPIEMQGDFLGSHSNKVSNISDTHVLLKKEIRFMYNGGSVFIIEAKPWNRSKFHRDASIERSLIPHLFFWKYDINKPEDEYERSYIAVSEDGIYKAGSIPEGDFQEAIQETGFIMPETNPYRFNLGQFGVEDEFLIIANRDVRKRKLGMELLAFLVLIGLLIVILRVWKIRSGKAEPVGIVNDGAAPHRD